METNDIYNKIIVLGPSGAGKSTFSRKISKIFNVPLYPLDNIFWNEKMEHISKDEFDQKLADIIKKEKWIIDGDYSRTYEIRMKNADTIFFLDYSLDVCLSGVEARIGIKRDDCPFVETQFDSDFKEWIINWFKETKPVIDALLSKYKEKNIIVFKNREEADSYINSIEK